MATTNGFTDLLNQTVNQTSTQSGPSTYTDPRTGQAVVDVFGIGQQAGTLFPIGTTQHGGDGQDHHGGKDNEGANGPGHTAPKGTRVDTTTADDYLHLLAKLSQTNPDQYMAIQQGLYAAGFYGDKSAKDVGFGRWNAATKDALIGTDGALKNFLELYSSGSMPGMTFNEWLSKQSQLAAADPNSPGNGGGAGGAGQVINLSDPNSISASANNSSDQLLGRGFNQDETNSIVSQVHDSEAASQTAAGGSTVTSTDPTAAARNFVIQNNLPEYAAHQAEGYMNVFANMFLSGQSGRANTSLGDIAIGNK